MSSQSSTRKIAEKIEIINDRSIFYGFDVYMTMELLEKTPEQWMEADARQQDAWRMATFKKLNTVLGKKKIVSRPTLRRWFALDGEMAVFPKREQILKAALALSFDENQLQRCLRQGLQEPGIQINDYQEILCLYCAAHHFDDDKYEDMLQIFEQEASGDTELKQKSHTSQLWNMYRVQKEKEPAAFLEWMIEHAAMFKGYGKMGLKVFHEYREKIVYYANKEVHERLVNALDQTDFKEWSAEHGYKEPDYDKGVVQYLKNKKRRKDPGIEEDTLKSIQRDHMLYYSKMEKNMVMLRELYAAILIPQEERDSGRGIVFEKRLKNMPPEFHFMTDDYVSKLLTVSKQKECLFRFSSEYAKTNDRKWSLKVKSQKQRCRQVQRADILPMIQWVAVHRYLEENEKSDHEYNQQEAKEMFEQMAEEALRKCDMAPLNPAYRLDFVLLSCFADTEMSYLSEILYEYVQNEEE